MSKRKPVSSNPPNTVSVRRKKRSAEEARLKPEELTVLNEICNKENELRKANAALKREIEERKKAERELRTEKDFSEAIIEAIPSMFYVVDEYLDVMKWNKNVEKVTGYTPDDIRRMKGPEFFRDEDVPFVKEKIAEVFSKGSATCYASYRFKDGKCAPYLFTGVKARINDRDYQIGVGIDCAEIEEAKEALCESEERLALAADSAEAGLWVLDSGTGNLWMTQKCRELHGLPPDSLVNYEALIGVLHAEDRGPFAEAMQYTMSTGEDLQVEYRVMLPDERFRWLNVRGRLHLTLSGAPDRLMGVSLDITERKLMEEQLKDRMAEVVRLKEQLEQDNVYLREEAKLLFKHEEMIGRSVALKNVLLKVEQVAATDSTVLILGETGTGKELVARAIHNMSKRRDRPLVTVNCASLPPSLIEGELFGREKGAYTGALTKMVGRFEAAHGSTLFLDEIGELPLELQGKLLQAIELGRFERLGSTRTIQVDVRIIAATNRDIRQAVKEGKFRKDLYYRLNIFPITVPPLREHSEDIPDLVSAFVGRYEKKLGKRIESVSHKTMNVLTQYAWPGNVRELKNVVEHAVIVSNKILRLPLPMTLEERDDC